MMSSMSDEEIKEFFASDRKEMLDEYEKSKVGEILKDTEGREGYYWAEKNYPKYPDISYFLPVLCEELDQNLIDNIPLLEQGLISIETFNNRLFSIRSKKEPDKPLRLNALHMCQIASFFILASEQDMPNSRTLADLIDFFDNERFHYRCSSALKAMIIIQYYGITESLKKELGIVFDLESKQFFKLNQEQENEISNKSQQYEDDGLDW